MQGLKKIKKKRYKKVNDRQKEREKRRHGSWNVFRKKILRRDNYQCRMCGRHSKLEVHHKLSVLTHKHLELNFDNCITLCIECHNEVHRQKK